MTYPHAWNPAWNPRQRLRHPHGSADAAAVQRQRALAEKTAHRRGEIMGDFGWDNRGKTWENPGFWGKHGENPAFWLGNRRKHMGKPCILGGKQGETPGKSPGYFGKHLGFFRRWSTRKMAIFTGCKDERKNGFFCSNNLKRSGFRKMGRSSIFFFRI